MATLLQAHTQWARRPDDERFWNLAEMRAASRAVYEASAVADVPAAGLRFEGNGGRELRLVSDSGRSARFSYHGFGAVAQLVGAPAEFVRKLPTTTAADVLRCCASGAGSSSRRAAGACRRRGRRPDTGARPARRPRPTSSITGGARRSR